VNYKYIIKYSAENQISLTNKSFKIKNYTNYYIYICVYTFN